MMMNLLCYVDGDKDKGLSIARDFVASGQLVLYKNGEQGCRTIYNDNAKFRQASFRLNLPNPLGLVMRF